MGKLTEFLCPKNIYACVIPIGSPSTLTALPAIVNHVALTTMDTSGLVGLGFASTVISGTYIPTSTLQTFDVTIGSISFYGEHLGSLNVVGYY